MQFNEKLKQYRTEKGMTQAELAEKVFVSRSAVAKWENGLGLPNEQSLALLAECFGVEPTALLSDPETETVIVNQNGTLSRQKIWIVALAGLFLIAAILTAIFVILNGQKPPIPIPEPIVTRELIFESEQDLQTNTIPNYSDEKVADEGLYFSPTRTFTVTDDGKTALPTLLMKVTTDGVVTYEQIDINQLTSSSERLSLRSEGEVLVITVQDSKAFAEIGTNLKYNDLAVSVKVYKRPAVPVEGLYLSLADGTGTIGLAETHKKINVSYMPQNASYPDYKLSVEKILHPDGSEYEGDLSAYATIEENGYLSTTEKLELGAAIRIIATTNAEGFRSNPFIVYVTRIPIERISDYNLYFGSFITLGEKIKLSEVKVLPENATYNILHEQATVTLLTPNFGTLEKTETGYLLTATTDMSAVNSDIEIEVNTPEGISRIFKWEIKGIPAESVLLLNADTGEKIDDIIYLTRGSTLRLKTFVYPENATYDRVSWTTFSNTPNFGAYVDLSDEGVLTVSDRALLELEVSLGATVGLRGLYGYAQKSETHRVIVQKQPVERVTLSLETSEVVKGKVYFMTREVFPANADIIGQPHYDLLEEVEGIYLSANLLFVTTAKGGTVFHIQVEIDGVKSNILELTVIENPLEQLEISLETDQVLSWQIYEIKVNTQPSYADYEELTFSLLDEIDGIYLSGNKLFISPNVKSGTVFRVQAVADGIESNVLTLTVVDGENPADALVDPPHVLPNRKKQ